MVEKYGKTVDMRNLGRNIDGLKKMMESNKSSRGKMLKRINEPFNFTCRICQSPSGEGFIDIDGYKYVLCDDCGAVVLVNLPDVNKLYKEDGVSIDHYMDTEIFQKRVKSIGIPKVNFVADVIMKQEPNILSDENIWCDIGCGVGELLMAINQISSTHNLNFSAVGIESDPREIAFGQKFGLNIQHGYLDPDAQEECITELISKANVVSMFNVLEHIPFPNKIINYLTECMKKDSILVVEVPRHPSLASFANQTSFPQYNYRHITPPQHLQIFTEKSIDILYGDSFSLIAKWGFGQGYTDLLTNAMLMGGKNDNSLYVELMKISNEVQERIDEMGYSDAMIYVAKKL